VPFRIGRVAVLAFALILALFSRFAVAAEPARVVVFVVPSGVDLDAALRDALTAQLSGGGTEMVFEHFSEEATTLRRQVNEARALSVKYSSVGVFWLEAPMDKDWLLYLAEPTGDRVLVRRVTVEAGGTVAATEAVAVITSESTEALARGQKLGMTPVTLPPETLVAAKEPSPFTPPPAPRPVPPPPPRDVPHGVSVALAYYGDSTAHEVPWQSGAHVDVTYRARMGLYAGLGFTFFREIDIEDPSLAFQVSRTPFDAMLGIALSRRGFRVGGEVRSIVEMLTRRNVSSSESFATSPGSTRALIYVGPRLRLEQDLTRSFALYAAGGIDVALNPFSFVSRVDGQDRVLLQLSEIRPAIEVGALLWP